MRADKKRRLEKRRQPGIETLERRAVLDASAFWSDGMWSSGPYGDEATTDQAWATSDVVSAESAAVSAADFTLAVPPAAPPNLRLTVPPSVIKGNVAAFELTLPAPAGPGGASVSFRTVDIGAKAGIDYTAQSGRITFAPGETGKLVAVQTRPGSTPGTKPLTFALVLSQPVGVKLGTTTAVTTIITRDQQFNHVFGYGLANASFAVAQASGRTAPFTPVTDLGGNFWGDDLVRAPEVWAQGYTGRGVTVAVVDSGVDYTHPDLAANIWVNRGEVPNDGIDNDNNGFIDDVRGWFFDGTPSGSKDPMDDNGHGTHVAGTIAALNNDIGITGVAPDAKIMPIKIGGATADAIHTSMANAVLYAANNGARVINMSVRTLPVPGSGQTSRPVPALEQAIAYATGRGATVVMAAGNFVDPLPTYPARYALTYGLSVGAVDNLGRIASFSNLAGPTSQQFQVMAPGVEVYSTLPGASFGRLSGTSMASPHVAGVAALMVGANPRITPSQVRSIVTGTAQRLTGQIITARPSQAAAPPFLSTMVTGLDKPLWVVPGSPIPTVQTSRSLARSATASAAVPSTAFASMAGDDLSSARRARATVTTAVAPAASVDAGGVTDVRVPRKGLVG